MTNGDTAIWIGQGDDNGHFTIPNVPEGNYTLTWWDSNLNYILDLVQVSVGANESVDMGVLPLTGWWTKFEGYVYNDTNKNGKRDPGEAGLANYPVVMRKRENSLMDRGAVAVTTDANGYYVMDNAYPMTQWLVMEAYDDLHYSTGITYQADNQPTETTIPGEGVDVSVLPIIGLAGRLDWGKHSYEAGTNGGIVGTVSYDTTRNEVDPRFSAVENWQPGVSNLPVNLYAPVACGTNAGAPCDASGRYELEANGAFKKATVESDSNVHHRNLAAAQRLRCTRCRRQPPCRPAGFTNQPGRRMSGRPADGRTVRPDARQSGYPDQFRRGGGRQLRLWGT